MGFNWLLYGVVAMIIGGVGSNWGLAGGALLLATAQHLAAYYIGSQWMDAVAYIILILFLIAKSIAFIDTNRHIRNALAKPESLCWFWRDVHGGRIHFLVFLPEALRFVGMPNAIAANVRQIIYGAMLIFMMFRHKI